MLQPSWGGAAVFSFLLTSPRAWHNLSSQEYSAALAEGQITDLSPRRGLIEVPHLEAEAAPEGTTTYSVAQVKILGNITVAASSLSQSLSLSLSPFCPPLLNPINQQFLPVYLRNKLPHVHGRHSSPHHHHPTPGHLLQPPVLHPDSPFCTQ